MMRKMAANKDKILKNLPLILFFLIFLAPQLGARFFVLILIILAIIFAWTKLFAPLLAKSKNMSTTIDVDAVNSLRKGRNIFLSLIGAFLLVWLFFASIVIVEAGQTGVYSLFGKVKDQELKSGFHLVIPLAKVTKMSIRTEEYTMSIAQNEGKKSSTDAITSLTKEGLSVDLDMTVLYRINEDAASVIYTTVGIKDDIDEKIIRPAIRTAIRDVIAQYEAKDIYSEKRSEAAVKIKEILDKTMAERGIIIEEVLLRNVALPENLAKAIQEKLQAEQEAQKYDFVLQKEKKEKERKIIEAEGQRDAQRIINESLTPNYLYYIYVSNLKDRQGTIYVPTAPENGMPLFKGVGN